MRLLTFALLVAAATSPAVAGGVWASHGGWTVYREDTGCMMQKVQPREGRRSVVRLYQFADGKTAVEMESTGWSIRKDDKRQVYLVFDTDGVETSAIARSDRRILMQVQPQVLRSFSASSTLTAFLKVDEDHQVPLEQFSLSQSGLAIKSTGHCVATVIADDGPLRRQAPLLPSDPFASAE